MPRATLRPGLTHEFRYRVPKEHTVPYLYPEAEAFQDMPEVFATGFMVGLLEWTCVQLLMEHLDWPDEQSLGTLVECTHEAATPPGLEVTVNATLVEVDGRRLRFDLWAHDGVDTISRGSHERMIVDRARFLSRVQTKADSAREA
ncbi:MAG: thioesterase family protein [Acidimicrobiales bacterium]